MSNHDHIVAMLTAASDIEHTCMLSPYVVKGMVEQALAEITRLKAAALTEDDRWLLDDYARRIEQDCEAGNCYWLYPHAAETLRAIANKNN